MTDWNRASCAGVQERAELSWGGLLEKVTGLGKLHNDMSLWEPLGTAWKMMSDCLFSGETVQYFNLIIKGPCSD